MSPGDYDSRVNSSSSVKPLYCSASSYLTLLFLALMSLVRYVYGIPSVWMHVCIFVCMSVCACVLFVIKIMAVRFFVSLTLKNLYTFSFSLI